MIYESDDAANRVEEIATELPGEFRWHMWIRGFAGMAVTVPAYGVAFWSVGTVLGAGPWWLIAAVLAAVVAGFATVVAVLRVVGRHEKPQKPLSYLLWVLRSEAAAPRRPDTTAVGASPIPVATGPLTVGAPVAPPTRFRSRCDYPSCPPDGVA